MDALHLDSGGVTRGPTVQRTALRPDIDSSFRLLDGNTWVTFYDTAVAYAGQLGSDTTQSGVMWMLMGIGNSNGPGTTELVRWRPGNSYFEAFPIEFNIGEDVTRPVAALDDQTVVVLDLNTGRRIRAFTFPPFASN